MASAEVSGPPGAAPWTHTGFAQRLVFGSGTVAQVGELLRAVGARRAMLVTTAGRSASEDGDRLRRSIGSVLTSTFAEVTSHAPAPMVQAAVLQARVRDGRVADILRFDGAVGIEQRHEQRLRRLVRERGQIGTHVVAGALQPVAGGAGFSEHLAARLGEDMRERHADIARADDRDLVLRRGRSTGRCGARVSALRPRRGCRLRAAHKPGS